MDKTTSITTIKKEMLLQEWAAQIEAQQASGLTIREWCTVYTPSPQSHLHGLSEPSSRIKCHTLPGSARGQSAESVGKKSVQLWQSELYIHCAVQQRQRCGFVTVKIRFQVRADAVL